MSAIPSGGSLSGRQARPWAVPLTFSPCAADFDCGIIEFCIGWLGTCDNIGSCPDPGSCEAGACDAGVCEVAAVIPALQSGWIGALILAMLLTAAALSARKFRRVRS